MDAGSKNSVIAGVEFGTKNAWRVIRIKSRGAHPADKLSTSPSLILMGGLCQCHLKSDLDCFDVVCDIWGDMKLP